MLQQAKQRIEQADFIVIGAGAGFFAAAGLTYSGERFTQRFQPFIQRYGMKDMYSAEFYPLETEEEKWAYWAEHIWANRFEPSAYVLHAVGPIISGALSAKDGELLASCYRSCLELAKQHGIESVAFCCISTGEFRLSNREAAEIAVKTVKAFLADNPQMKVVFNVFKDVDWEIYRGSWGSTVVLAKDFAIAKMLENYTALLFFR